MKLKQNILLVILLLLSTIFCYSQQKYTISGHVKDSQNGEELAGASVYAPEIGGGASTNMYGFYSLTIPKGKYNLIVSYMGYKKDTFTVTLDGSMKMNIELEPTSQMLQTVEIVDQKADENVRSVEMSMTKIPIRNIKRMPSFMGEVDIIKSIQLLPGVSVNGEGNTGFYVRGGNSDQNLILLDGAPVYNSSHIGGLFSVFNSDAVKDIKLYKGGIPPVYGGRLSSILDIRMKEGNMKKLSASGGIGIISSRLTVEGPIKKDKSSFILSGRRTYVDLFFPMFRDTLLQKARAYFYDLNSKVNYIINDKNRVFVSGYFGRDVLKPSDDFLMSYGNATLTTRWNHLFTDKLFSNFTALYSNYDYNIGVPEGRNFSFNWKSRIINKGFKAYLNYYLNPKNTVKFGYDVSWHTFDPGEAKGLGDESMFTTIRLPDNHCIEHAMYFQNEQKVTEFLTVLYGTRYSILQNVGKGIVYDYDKTDPKKYIVSDSTKYSSGEKINTYNGFEPRIGVSCRLNALSSIKVSYNRMYQFIQLASNSTAATPLDIWFSSSMNIEPQKADQVALGYFRNFINNAYETSVEVYYKKMYNSIDYRDHANLYLNRYFEGELRIGSGYSYGLECLVRKQKGKLTGWVSYTYSKTRRTIPEINDGNEYAVPYDKPHDVSFVVQYDVSKRVNVSGNWVYSTASPRTMPTARFGYQGMVAPVFSDRNTVRIFDYHRMDLSVTLKNKNKKKKNKEKKRKYNVESSWNLSIYNAYMQKNPFSITFNQSDDDPLETEAEMLYLFKMIPAITYNFKF